MKKHTLLAWNVRGYSSVESIHRYNNSCPCNKTRSYLQTTYTTADSNKYINNGRIIFKPQYLKTSFADFGFKHIHVHITINHVYTKETWQIRMNLPTHSRDPISSLQRFCAYNAPSNYKALSQQWMKLKTKLIGYDIDKVYFINWYGLWNTIHNGLWNTTSNFHNWKMMRKRRINKNKMWKLYPDWDCSRIEYITDMEALADDSDM